MFSFRLRQVFAASCHSHTTHFARHSETSRTAFYILGVSDSRLSKQVIGPRVPRGFDNLYKIERDELPDVQVPGGKSSPDHMFASIIMRDISAVCAVQAARGRQFPSVGALGLVGSRRALSAFCQIDCPSRSVVKRVLDCQCWKTSQDVGSRHRLWRPRGWCVRDSWIPAVSSCVSHGCLTRGQAGRGAHHL